MEATVKAVFATVIIVAMLIASFYMAYLIILLLAMGVIGAIAYTWFNRDMLFSKPYFDD